MLWGSPMANDDEQLMEARSRVYWAKEKLKKLELKADESGNYAGYEFQLNLARKELAFAEGRLAHLESKRDVPFGGI
jgi:hypothetical protein